MSLRFPPQLDNSERPALVTDWREGRDTDGGGGPLDPDLRWQAELWRRLLVHVGTTPPDVRHAETVERLRSGGADLDLPPRLSLFGHTRLPVTEVALLRALGDLREVPREEAADHACPDHADTLDPLMQPA